jgi:hypothetical protein
MIGRPFVVAETAWSRCEQAIQHGVARQCCDRVRRPPTRARPRSRRAEIHPDRQVLVRESGWVRSGPDRGLSQYAATHHAAKLAPGAESRERYGSAFMQREIWLRPRSNRSLAGAGPYPDKECGSASRGPLGGRGPWPTSQRMLHMESRRALKLPSYRAPKHGPRFDCRLLKLLAHGLRIGGYMLAPAYLEQRRAIGGYVHEFLGAARRYSCPGSRVEPVRQ